MKLGNLTISALALILMTACTEATGVDETTGVEPDALAGTWTSTSMVLTSVANNTLSIDLVAEDGPVATVVLGADGTYTFTYVSDVEPTENETGTYTVSGSTLTIDPTGTKGPETFTISRTGDTMTMTGLDNYDFTPGVFVDATMVIVLTR
jgi:hypothetical protein